MYEYFTNLYEITNKSHFIIWSPEAPYITCLFCSPNTLPLVFLIIPDSLTHIFSMDTSPILFICNINTHILCCPLRISFVCHVGTYILHVHSAYFSTHYNNMGFSVSTWYMVDPLQWQNVYSPCSLWLFCPTIMSTCIFSVVNLHFYSPAASKVIYSVINPSGNGESTLSYTFIFLVHEYWVTTETHVNV